MFNCILMTRREPAKELPVVQRSPPVHGPRGGTVVFEEQRWCSWSVLNQGTVAGCPLPQGLAEDYLGLELFSKGMGAIKGFKQTCLLWDGTWWGWRATQDRK